MHLTIDSPSILVCTQPVDFRKSIDGLLDVILSSLDTNPRTGIFVFFNRARNRIKILAWHKNGFILLLKRLEQGRFFDIKNKDSVVQVTPGQLSWLIAGLDWVKMTEWGELEYRDFR